jgi:hypothetical protein
MIGLYVVSIFEIMWLSLLLMLANTMKEEEKRALFMLPPYLKFKLRILICIGYHKLLLFIDIQNTNA